MRLEAQWIVGFVDGEGCFHISINKNDTMTAGFQVLPELLWKVQVSYLCLTLIVLLLELVRL